MCLFVANCFLRLASCWTSRPDGDLSSGSQIKIVSTLNVYRSGTGAGTHDRANRRTLTTARNRADEGANRRTDRGASDCLVRLVGVANRTFVINPNDVAVRRAHRLENTGEAVTRSIAQANRVEVHRQSRTTADATSATNVGHCTLNRRAIVLARRANSHRKAIAFAHRLCRQIIVEHCDDLGSVWNHEAAYGGAANVRVLTIGVVNVQLRDIRRAVIVSFHDHRLR